MYDIKSCFQIVCVPLDLEFLGKALDYHNDFMISSSVRRKNGKQRIATSTLSLLISVAICADVPVSHSLFQFLRRSWVKEFYKAVPLRVLIALLLTFSPTSFPLIICCDSYSHGFRKEIIFFRVGLLAPRPTLLSHPGLGPLE